ncbi:MAG: amidase [Streptosporangiales bacterium]|nr:amidase [Streptosporangiales bacterium]
MGRGALWAEGLLGEDGPVIDDSDATREALTRIREIDRTGPSLHAVLALNPAAEADADRLEAERAAGRVRGPLHGVPILVKDNIDMAGLATTAGSLAMAGNVAVADAPLVTRLRAAGTVIVGKANMSEWANFRAVGSTSGWSALGGLCRNPHALDRSAGGSSSGSGVAVAAGMVPLAIGTETDGSITCPSAFNGVVGIKPTVGLVPGQGIIPVAHSQDTFGPMATSVRDAAVLLDVLADAGGAYASACVPDGLRGARIGLPRHGMWGNSPRADAVAEEAVRLLAAGGATIVDPADLKSIDELGESDAEMIVLHTEFKVDVEEYLAGCAGDVPRTLAEVVRFNEDHAAEELRHFGQDRFERALETGGYDDPAYQRAVRDCRRLGRDEGIDAALRAHDLDALVMPTYPPAWKIDLINGDHLMPGCSRLAAIAGYPIVTLPCGEADGLPIGLAFVGTARSEPVLIRLAHALERALDFSLKPTFRPPETG